MDYSQLHFSIKDMKLDSGEATARPTLLDGLVLEITTAVMNAHNMKDCTLPIKQKNSIKENTNYCKDRWR